MIKPFLISSFGLLFLASSLSGQGPGNPPDLGEKKPPELPVNQTIWQATLPGGHYMVRLDRISSISRHSYLLDGSVVVDEVTIDHVGQALARFYQLRPLTDLAKESNTGASAANMVDRAHELTKSTVEKVGTNPTDMVVKKYPETTHARMIEYRIETSEQLTKLYESVRSAWESGRGKHFKIK